MSAAYQSLGALGIVLGLAGTWVVARHRGGWLVCIASSILWLPALVTGSQWVAVINCALSVAICCRNFLAASRPPRRQRPKPDMLRRPPRAVLVVERRVSVDSLS